MSLKWMEDGACRQVDPDSFFPNSGDNPRRAKEVCGNCPVLARCFAYALADPTIYGVWGGTTLTERKAIRRADAARVSAASVRKNRALELLASGLDPQAVAARMGITERSIHRWRAAA